MKQSKTTFTKRKIDVERTLRSVTQYFFVVCLAMVISLVGGAHFYIIGHADVKVETYEDFPIIEATMISEEEFAEKELEDLTKIIIEPFPERMIEENKESIEIVTVASIDNKKEESVHQTVIEETEAVVEAPSEAVSTYVMELNAHDRAILEQIVEAEVTGDEHGFRNVSREEVLKSKIRVAQVVLNRVNAKGFKSTIEGVVFEKNQFSPIIDGRYWKVSVCDLTREAVELALRSDTPDYSNGALFFTRGKKCGAKASYLFTDAVGHSFFK